MRNLTMKQLARAMNFWPPYFGAGVSVRGDVTSETGWVEVSMRLRFWNTNAVGTHFGGSLYSMCDPYFMLILMRQIGRDYIVWDKAATIRFKKPGKGNVKARFEIPQSKAEEIRALADSQPKVEPVFVVEIRDEHGEVVAEVEKLLYVRRKDRSPKSQEKKSV